MRLIVKTIKRNNLIISTLLPTILSTLINFSLFAFSSPPGLIPLKYNNTHATDLIYQGEVLLPQELHQLIIDNPNFDISKLNPEESAIWKNSGFSKSEELISVNDNDSVDYISPVISRSGNFRFSIIKKIDGRPKTFIVMVNKKIHNVLLNKALLAKLGYFTSPIKYLSKLRINFDNEISKKAFLVNMFESTFGDTKRWVIDDEFEEAQSLTMQDMIIMPADDYVYNLSLGIIPSSIIKGRRVLNALQLPYALLDIPESLNLFSWSVGRIISNQVKLDLSEENTFSTSFEDAKWILARIAKLTKADFNSIVAESYLPEEAKLLLTEKLISRRNSLITLFKQNYPQLDINQQISSGVNLIAGKLKKENWDGHSERLAYGDPDSPLSSSEIFAFLKSKVFSNVLSNLLSMVNSEIKFIDLEKEIYKKQYELAQEQFMNFLATGKMEKTPFGFWTVPTASANLLASREIVSGSYMGIDNKVQLADTIGFSANAGLFIGTNGISTPWAVNGSVQATFFRNYTHLQPIKSMKKALAYPFKNIMVPRLNNSLANIFSNIEEIRTEADSTIRQKKLETIFASFDEAFATGESIVITDSIGVMPMLTTQYGFTEKISAYASLMANSTVISRLHIYKKDSSTIQIYKSVGDMGRIGISMGLKGFLPIINIQKMSEIGSANTDFYTLNINSNEKNNPEIFLAITALKDILSTNSIELLSALKSPYKLHHDFTQKSTKLSFLPWRWSKRADQDLLTIAHPSGGSKKFLRMKEGKLSRNNYEQFLFDIANAIKDEFLDLSDIDISTTGGENSASSVFGKSYGKTMQIEGEIEAQNREGDRCANIERPFINVTESWRGWSIKRDEANKIISEINQKFHGRFFQNNEIFLHTKKLQLYEIKFQTFIYTAGIDFLLSSSKKKLRNIFYKYSDKEEGVNDENVDSYTWENRLQLNLDKIIKYIEKHQESVLACKPQEASKYLMEIFKIINEHLTFGGLVDLVGGEANLYAFANVQGFRTKEEAGDRPYISNSIGEFGDKNILGPLSNIQNKIEMNENEFFAYWILERF